MGEALKNWFTYHAPTPSQRDRYESLRSSGLSLALLIHGIVPDCSEKYESMKRLRESIMWANAGIACGEARHAPLPSRSVHKPEAPFPPPGMWVVEKVIGCETQGDLCVSEGRPVFSPHLEPIHFQSEIEAGAIARLIHDTAFGALDARARKL